MGRILDSLPSHHKTLQPLLEAREQGRLAQTILFVGAPGSDKTPIALGLLQTLVCERDSLGCGVCGACLRVERRQSESLMLVSPEKNVIRIEKSREIIEWLSWREWSRARAVLIEDAHLLNPASANALLKVLEDPPEKTYFFLTTVGSRSVLPTIRSRSQLVRIGGEVEFKKEPGMHQAASDMARAWLQRETVFLQPDCRELIRDRKDCQSLVFHLLHLYRDAIVNQISPTPSEPIVVSLAQRSSTQLHSAVKLLITAEQSLGLQRDPQLVFEEFWIRSLEAT